MRKTACMGTCFVHAAGFASTVADASKLQSYQEDELKRFHVIRKSFPVFFWLKTNKNLAKCKKPLAWETFFVHAVGFASTVADTRKLQSYQGDESKRFDVIQKIFPAFFWLKPHKNLKNCEKLRATVAPRRPRERNFPTHARPVTP